MPTMDQVVPQYPPPRQLSSYRVGESIEPVQTSFLSQLEQLVVFNSMLQTSSLLVHFQRVLPTAIDRAIMEINSSTKQRTAFIATQTTKELVFKDYAMETDENCIRNAAHHLVSSLAGSLAHVTCKEPLRASLAKHLRSLLRASDVGNNQQLEEAIVLVTDENLDLGCAIIEQAATDTAVEAIDKEITRQLAIRCSQPLYFY